MVRVIIEENYVLGASETALYADYERSRSERVEFNGNPVPLLHWFPIDC